MEDEIKIKNALEKSKNKAIESIHNLTSIKSIFNTELSFLNPEEIIVSGSIEERIVLIKHNDNIIASCINFKIDRLKEKIPSLSIIKKLGDNDYLVDMTKSAFKRIISPKTYLVSLYHIENFPFPRFPLGISNIASSLRDKLEGLVYLDDMQINTSTKDIIKNISINKYEIIGISITFGQQDILNELLKKINEIKNYSPTIIIGGSLASLNYEYILHNNNVLVAHSSGESIMLDVVKYWRGEIPISEIKGIYYIDKSNEIVKTQNNDRLFSPPELDLLDKILKNKGVMQLETTRGCHFKCSFCPREHKGKWSSIETYSNSFMKSLSNLFNLNKFITRKIFLVDEEFIGYSSTSERRTESIAKTFHDFNFKFESSSRIDQVYRPSKNKEWHIKRINLWKLVKNYGLERMLFGVESGADSILTRFNKSTTTEQNIRAIRILTAIGIPIRCTFITFDPLMSMDELIKNYNFLIRKDIILPTDKNNKPETILEYITDDEICKRISTQQPFYTKVPYLLASLECLNGSNYLNEVKKHKLDKENITQMGKTNASYLNKTIELLSYYSQLWIDKNFAFDYSLKSMTKILKKEDRSAIYKLRRIIKDSSIQLFGMMLYICNNNHKIALIKCVDVAYLENLKNRYCINNKDIRKILHELLSYQHEKLTKEIIDKLTFCASEINHDHQTQIKLSLKNWLKNTEWELINKS